MSIETDELKQALKMLLEEVAQIKAQTGEKPLSKEDILAIKDDGKRLQAISENMHLFRSTDIEQTPQQKAYELSNRMALKSYGITDDELEHMTIEDVLKTIPSGLCRTYAIEKIIEREREK